MDLSKKLMRAIKVSPKEYADAVKRKAEHGDFMKITSSNGHIFTGILMPGGVWVSWPETEDKDPENGLTEYEMKLYIERYGSIPDLFTLKGHS